MLLLLSHINLTLSPYTPSMADDKSCDMFFELNLLNTTEAPSLLTLLCSLGGGLQNSASGSHAPNYDFISELGRFHANLEELLRSAI